MWVNNNSYSICPWLAIIHYWHIYWSIVLYWLIVVIWINKRLLIQKNDLHKEQTKGKGLKREAQVQTSSRKTWSDSLYVLQSFRPPTTNFSFNLTHALQQSLQHSPQIVVCRAAPVIAKYIYNWDWRIYCLDALQSSFDLVYWKLDPEHVQS